MSNYVAIVRLFTEWLKEYSGTDPDVILLSKYARTDRWWPTTGNTQGMVDYLEGYDHPEGVVYPGGSAPFNDAWVEWKATLVGEELEAAYAAERP